jgi:hypothetical protein
MLIITKIITGSKKSDLSPCITAVIKEIAAAMSKIIIMKSENCSKNFKSRFFFLASRSLFAPCARSLSRASDSDNPRGQAAFKARRASDLFMV